MGIDIYLSYTRASHLDSPLPLTLLDPTQPSPTNMIDHASIPQHTFPHYVVLDVDDVRSSKKKTQITWNS